MSKTRKLACIYLFICIAAIVGIVYMFCTLGSEKAMLETFELVQQENSNWDDAMVKDLEVKAQYYLGNGTEASFTYNAGEVFDIEIDDDTWINYGVGFEDGYGASVDEYMDYIEKEKNGVRLGEDRMLYYDGDGWGMYNCISVNEETEDMVSISTGCIKFEKNRLTKHNSLCKGAGDKIYLFYGGNLYVTNKEELLKIYTYEDIDIARGTASSMNLAPIYSWEEEKEWLMCSDFVFGKEQYLVLVGSESYNDECFAINVHIIDANTGEEIDAKKEYINLDEFTVSRNVNMIEEFKVISKQDYSAGDYIKYNMLTTEYSLVTATQICGYQNMIKIDYLYNQEGKMSGINLSNINVATENREYISTMIDTCESEDGTVYLCYLEGIRGRERQYTHRWARRMIVDGENWGFKENRDEGWLFDVYEDEYPTEYWFNGVGIRAFKNGEMVYWGYFESDISKLFAESVKGVMRCETSYATNGADLMDMKINIVA
ncbi:MAG: hypothetical protein IJD02_02845 [Lachnospiraceae bacterium]|nr:hypothetical protein [Lachnospiraceae bacterium]